MPTVERIARPRVAYATALRGTGSGGRSLTYAYDDAGNLTSRSSSVTADAGASLGDHGAAAATTPPGPNAAQYATVGGTRSRLAYDAAGRATSATVCTSTTSMDCTAKSGADHRYFTWNARGLATRVTHGGSADDATPTVREDLAYGPDGGRSFRKSVWTAGSARRTERRFSVGTFEEALPDATATDEWVRKTLVTDHVLHVRRKARGGAETSAFEYLHRDHLGSVTAVTDAARTVSRRAAFDPFGARRKTDWSAALTAAETAAWADGAAARSTLGFAGHEQLDRAGLVDMRGRLYDPQLGVFLSPDPVVSDAGSAQGWNLYGHVGNRPLSRVDPSGRTFAGTGCNLAGVGCQPLGGGFSPSAPLAGSAVAWFTWIPVLTVSYQGGRWGASVVWGMGADEGRPGWRGGPRWSVHLDWLPVWGVSSRWARVEAGVARDTADEPMEPPRRRVVAWVGGAADGWSRVVKSLYESHKESPYVGDDDTEYFKHWERGKLADWIQKHQDAHITVIGHSWGAAAAARVVAQGNAVDKLVTVDPVSRRWRRRDALGNVAKHAGVWHNYDSVSRKWYRLPNIISRLGGRWNDAPEAFANEHTRVDLDHVRICLVHCAP